MAAISINTEIQVDKIALLTNYVSTPVYGLIADTKDCDEAIGILTLSKYVEKSVVKCIDEELLFTVETDASDFAIAATLNQEGRPVTFF